MVDEFVPNRLAFALEAPAESMLRVMAAECSGASLLTSSLDGVKGEFPNGED